MPRAFTDAERTRVRAALLDAARAAAGRGGLRRVPIDALTRAAGISKGAFYLFFDSKEALLEALLKETEADLRARLGAAAGHGPPDQRVRAVLTALFAAPAQHPLLSALTDPEEYAWLVRSLPPGALEAARADDDAWSARVQAELVAAGALRPDLPGGLLGDLGAVALALAAQRHLLGPGRFDPTVTLLVEALTARLFPAG